MLVAVKPNIRLESSWLEQLATEFDKPYMQALSDFLAAERQEHVVYPSGSNMFNAFNFTSFDKVKVVILGQDPYHGPGQAHGLCFSVPQGIKAPPSLVNIFKELELSLGIKRPAHGCLESWAQQGVFLLNTCMSVRAGMANSHAGQGWEIFTSRVIEVLNEKRDGIVFMLWGSSARAKAAMIDQSKHLILEAPHPSPLSAYRGFIGCGHFKTANEYLVGRGEEPINWVI
jgi:uracil-DNA glycosylase